MLWDVFRRFNTIVVSETSIPSDLVLDSAVRRDMADYFVDSVDGGAIIVLEFIALFRV